MNATRVVDTCKEAKISLVTTDINIEQIYERHVSTIYKICYMMLHNVEDAEDAVQTVFIKLMGAKQKFNSTEHEKAWLIVTAKNHCKNMLKHSWKKKRVDMEKIEVPFYKDSYLKQELLEEILGLGGKYQIVIFLYYYQGYSTKEIGKILNLNPATVRSRLYLARKKLKLGLEE